jgi:hypothetical protein
MAIARHRRGRKPASVQAFRGGSKTLGIVVAALLLLVLIVMLASGGQHGPGRHRGVSHAAAGAGAGLTLVRVTP